LGQNYLSFVARLILLRIVRNTSWFDFITVISYIFLTPVKVFFTEMTRDHPAAISSLRAGIIVIEVIG